MFGNSFGHSFFLDQKKLGHNVWKNKLVNTVTVSVDTIMGHMTEIFQRRKTKITVILSTHSILLSLACTFLIPRHLFPTVTFSS